MTKVCFLPSTLIRYRDLGSLESSTPFLNLRERKEFLFSKGSPVQDFHRLKFWEKTLQDYKAQEKVEQTHPCIRVFLVLLHFWIRFHWDFLNNFRVYLFRKSCPQFCPQLKASGFYFHGNCSKCVLPFHVCIILRHFTAQLYSFTNIGAGILQAFGHQNRRIFGKKKLQIYDLRRKTKRKRFSKSSRRQYYFQVLIWVSVQPFLP